MTPGIVRTRSAVFALAAAALLAGCSGDSDDAADASPEPSPESSTEPTHGTSAESASDSTVELRAVVQASHVIVGSDEPIAEGDELASLIELIGLGDGEGATEAAEWFAAGDCAAEPVSNAEAAAGCSTDGSEIMVMGPVAIDGSHVESAEFMEGESGDAVALMLDDTGTAALADLTQAAMEQTAPANRVAIVLDGEVVAAPTVAAPLTDGEVSIAGNTGDPNIRALADALG